MSDTIGKGVIELSSDATKLKAGIADAQRSIKGLGESTKATGKAASDSIDRYVKRLQTQAATLGMSTRETKLYELAQRGASAQQIASANAALRLTEAHSRGIAIGGQLRSGFIALGTAIGTVTTGMIASAIAFDRIVKRAGNFQDIAEKTGDSAEGFASLALAAGTVGLEIDTIAAASIKLTKNLTGVDDESQAAGAAVAALGLNIEALKRQSPAQQFETIANALDGFREGSGKTAVAVALLGKSGAELLPFFKELNNQGGRQVILTQAQIEAADAYSDSQAKLRTEVGLYAQSIAVQAIPIQQAFIAALVDSIKAALGVKSSIAEFAKDPALREFAENGARALAVLADGAFFVAQAFRYIGDNVGATAAQLVALGKLDFKGFAAIGRASIANNEAMSMSLGLVDRLDKRIADLNKGGGTSGFVDDETRRIAARARAHKETNRKTLTFGGAVKKEKKDNTIAQEAKAQLAFDLDQIKKATEGTTNTIANAERIMQAQRAAGLIEERQYYAARLDLLNRNSAAEEAGLQAELDRLQREKLVGKEKIDNDRKIADVQAQLAKARENASANVQVLQIQEAAALRQVAQGYRDAEDAAQAYLGTLTIANTRALAGLGAGNQARDRTAGRAQIEDKFSQQRQDLEKSRRDSQLNGTFGPDAQKQYDDELARIRRFQSAALAEYDVFFARRIAMERDWTIGAQEALTNYATDSLNISTQVEALFTNAFQGMEDALVNFVTTGKLSFTGLANSIIADITRIIIKQQILTPLSESISGGMSSGGGFGGLLGTLASSLFGGGGFGSGMANPFAKIVTGGSMRAIGGPVSAGGLYQVNERGPGELLQVAGRQYLMMGSQGGQVSPGTGLSSKTVNITVNQSFAAGTSRQTSTQAAADARRALEAGARNM